MPKKTRLKAKCVVNLQERKAAAAAVHAEIDFPPRIVIVLWKKDVQLLAVIVKVPRTTLSRRGAAAVAAAELGAN